MTEVVDALRFLDADLETDVRTWADVMTRVCAQLDKEGVGAAGVVLPADQLIDNGLQPADSALAGTDGRVFGWYGLSPNQLKDVGHLRALEYATAFRGAHVAPYRGGPPIDQPDWYALYATCQEMDLPLALEVGSAPARSGLRSVALPDLVDTVAFAFPNLKLLCVNRGRLWLPTLVRWARVHKNVYLGVGDNLARDWDDTLLESITHPVDYWHPDGALKVCWCSAVSSKPPAVLVGELLARNALNEDQVSRAMGLNINSIVGIGPTSAGAANARGLAGRPPTHGESARSS